MHGWWREHYRVQKTNGKSKDLGGADFSPLNSKPFEFLLYKRPQIRTECLGIERALKSNFSIGITLHSLQGNAVAHQPDRIVWSKLQRNLIMRNRLVVAILALQQRRQECLVIGLRIGIGQGLLQSCGRFCNRAALHLQLAKEESEDPESAARGGDIGYVLHGVASPASLAALPAVSPASLAAHARPERRRRMLPLVP